jgi:hypothetical protein
MSMSWVVRGAPNSVLAKDPVNMYGIPDASSRLVIRLSRSAAPDPDSIEFLDQGTAKSGVVELGVLPAQTLLDQRPRLLAHRDGNLEPSARAEAAQNLGLHALGFGAGVTTHGGQPTM